MNKELAKTIGTAARHARNAQRLTQEDAAERVGVSAEFYARIERGTSLPSILTFARIASALGVSADAMLGQHPLSMSAGVQWTQDQPSERPEIRRVLRRLRQASPGALRLVSLLLKEFEETERGQENASNSNENTDEADASVNAQASAESVNTNESSDESATSETLSGAHARDLDGAPARTLRARERENSAEPATGDSNRGWERAS